MPIGAFGFEGMDMLRIEMLPAGHGDALLVEYGQPGAEHRILIDGGPYYSYDDPGGLQERLKALQDAGKTEFELLVITHVDSDHIDGIIRLLQDPALTGLGFKDIWFNDWKQLQPKATGVLAGVHGEFLGALLDEHKLPWNSHPKLAGGPVMVPDTGDLPSLELAAGATITLLSPGPAELDNLRKDWKQSLRLAGFQPGDRKAALEELSQRARYGPPKGVLGQKTDDKAANGSSIAFLLEYQGKRLLLAGDAWSSVLERSLERYVQQHGESVAVQDFKLPHHGSFSNLSKRLIKTLQVERYLISSSSQYYKHPDVEAIELILQHHSGGTPTLVFNYFSPKTKPWADEELQKDKGYKALYPTGATWGVDS
jgi:hypothetical protein